jgi:hypothetical protein
MAIEVHPFYSFREIVPGTTAGTESPGLTSPAAGSPAPLFFGATAPTAQAQQISEPQLTDEVDSPFITAPGSPSPGVLLPYSTNIGIGYTQGYLETLIGQRIRVEFLFGESMLMDRRGDLLYVGIDYFIIREVDTDDELLCDLYSIKFVTVYK